jgi:hypothetical protein
LVRLVADLNCSVEGVLPFDFVFDHLGGRLDRLNFCRLVVGEYFALLISIDVINLYDVKWNRAIYLKRSDAMPVPPKHASARKNGDQFSSHPSASAAARNVRQAYILPASDALAWLRACLATCQCGLFRSESLMYIMKE